jgi:hypothetical protein
MTTVQLHSGQRNTKLWYKRQVEERQVAIVDAQLEAGQVDASVDASVDALVDARQVAARTSCVMASCSNKRRENRLKA